MLLHLREKFGELRKLHPAELSLLEVHKKYTHSQLPRIISGSHSSHLVLQLPVDSESLLFTPSQWSTGCNTCVNKLQVVFKVNCHICYRIYVFLVKLLLFLLGSSLSFLLSSTDKFFEYRAPTPMVFIALF